MASSSTDPQVIYLSELTTNNVGRIMKSTDGGANFTDITGSINNPVIIKIAISPHNSEQILIGCTQNPYYQSDERLYLTTNGGNNWQYVDYSSSEENRNVTDIVWSISNSHVAFLCAFQGGASVNCGNNGYGVFRTDDGGLNWSKKVNGLNKCNIYSLGAELGDRDLEYVYAGTQSGSSGISRSI
jgi:photosystem II stability/assembly factor-like uncharacterized protein